MIPSVLDARDFVRIVGSASIYPFITAAVERFYQDEKQAAPVVESTGTGGGFKAFCAGTSDNYPDIVMAARPMTSSEQSYCKKHNIFDPIEITIGLDAVVLVTVGAPFSVTFAELQSALSDKIERWVDLNSSLPHKPIRIMGPPYTSGVFDTFIELALAPRHLKLRQDGTYVEISQESVVVTKLELNPDTLGLISYTFLSQLKKALNPIPIDGITPTFSTVLSGQYPMVRKSYLYIKRERLPKVKSLSAFLRFLMSEPVSGVNGYLVKQGFVPLPQQEHQKQSQRLLQALKDYS